MKKWISVILVLSILNMFMVVTAGATYNKELYDTDSETIMQIDKMDGVEYYLEISNEYTLSMALHKDGMAEVALKYKDDPDKVFWNTYYPEQKSFERIKEDALNENVLLSNYEVQNLSVEAIANKDDCIDWLEDKHGKSYSYKTIATKSVDGYTVTIKEKHENSVTKKSHF